MVGSSKFFVLLCSIIDTNSDGTLSVEELGECCAQEGTYESSGAREVAALTNFFAIFISSATAMVGYYFDDAPNKYQHIFGPFDFKA